MTQPLDIAIVGLAGCYPGAADAGRYWRNILDKVDAVADAEAEWTGPYFEANTQADDRIYTTKGGFLRDLARVDPLSFGVMPSVAAGSDPDHLLALKFARDALNDAGYGERPFDRERAGVIIGRGTYGNLALGSTMSRGLFLDQAMDLVRGLRPDFSEADIRRLKDGLKGQLLPFQAEHIGVLTPNVVAGLVANRLNLMGPTYIVDAACASTLIAVEQAVRELQAGRSDLIITGGIHAHTPPQIFIQFCRINALSRDKIRPFQKGADGTLLGEGVGLMVLKRLADAERDGDRIYAVIKGIGTASDGKAKGLLAPRLEGEVLALRRAYESCGIDPRTIDLIEAHGTGTALGDKTEIEALSTVFGVRGEGPQIAISAVKSMIGHCMPASGGAALIKTALALHHKVLPPMLCDEPDPALELHKTPLYINTETRPWISGGPHPRRAGVNAFGFGGINSHVILEDYEGPRKTQVAMLHAPTQSAGGSELITLAADSREQLLQRAQQALAQLQGAQPLALDELAKACSAYARGAHRLAIVCSSADDLGKKLEQAIAKLGAADSKPFKTRGGLHYGHGDAPGKLCLLFPGEGSQYPQMLGDLAVQFPQLREAFDFIEQNAQRRGHESRARLLFPAPTGYSDAERATLEERLFEMDVAAESVFAASIGLHALLQDLGLQPDAMLGHSTGENTAMTACGINRARQRDDIARTLNEINAIYHRLEAAGQIAEGTLLTVGALTPALRTELLAQVQADPQLELAMDNCPNQVVLFGKPDAIAKLREQLAPQGAICMELPFGRAYHTPLFKPLADAFRAYFKTLNLGAGNTTLYSASICAPFPDDADGIRELTCRQWENPVRFTETVQRLYEDGYRVFLEVGPSSNLTSFVGDTLRDRRDVLALSSNSRRKSGLQHLHNTLAQLFTAGISWNPAQLYAHRAIADFDLAAAPRGAAKLAPSLKLITPVMILPDEFRKPLPASSASTAPISVASVAPAAATPAASSAAPASDPRLAALQAHFSLMQDFLDSQARVLGLVGAAPIAAPAASLPTAATATPMSFPMLGPLREHSEQRLICERRFQIDRDLFLRDHAIGGEPSARDPSLLPLPVIPFTFSMELIAEAGAQLLNRAGWVVTGIDNARGSRWLSLDDGSVGLRIVAERLPDRGAQALVACRVFLQNEGNAPGGLLVFEGQVELAAAYPAAPGAQPWPDADRQPPQIHQPGEIYAHGMFHGPRLQGCTRIEGWGNGGMAAEITVLPTHDYFADDAAPRFQFDAAALDAAGQLAGFWLRERYTEPRNCFPFRVRRLSLFAPPPAAGTRLHCQGAIAMQGDTQLEARWTLIGNDGRAVMQAEGWDDRVFAVPERFHRFRMDPQRAPLSQPALADQLPAELCVRRLEPLPEGLLDEGGTIWKRVLAHMVLSRREREQFYALPASGPRREEWLMGRLAAKDAVRDWLQLRHGVTLQSADIELLYDARGKPQVHCAVLLTMPSLSLAHSQRWACAVAADPTVSLGLDYQRLERLRADDLLRGAFVAAELAFVPQGNELARERASAALWCAKEAAAKAAGSGLEGRPQDWQVVAASLDEHGPGPTVARVRHGGNDYDVALHFEDSAILALCVTAIVHTPTSSGSPTRNVPQ